MATIEVIHFKVGRTRGELIRVENELDDLQALVGGPIELVRMKFGLVCLCHEEGRMRRLPVGWAISALIGVMAIHGDFFVCRTSGSEFTSVTHRDNRQIQMEVVPV